MNKLLRTFGNRLREVREEQGMSQEVLSKEAGYDRTYVGKVERGESSPSLKTIQEFADILDVEAWRLLKETEDRDE